MTSQSASLNRIFAIVRQLPLCSHEQVNRELGRIVTLVLRDTLSCWFAAVSRDDQVYAECVRVVARAVAEVGRRAARLDWVALLSRDVPEALCVHLLDHRACAAKLGTAYGGGRYHLPCCFYSKD